MYVRLADAGAVAVALGATAMAVRVGTDANWASTWGTGATWGAIAATVVATRIAARGIASSRETSRVETVIEHRRRAITAYAEYAAMVLTIRERTIALMAAMVEAGYEAEVLVSRAGVEFEYKPRYPAARERLLEEITALQKTLRLDYMPVHFLAAAATSDTELAGSVRAIDNDLSWFRKDLPIVLSAIADDRLVPGEPTTWINTVTRTENTIASGKDLIKEEAMSLDPEVVRRTLNLPAFGGRSWNMRP